MKLMSAAIAGMLAVAVSVQASAQKYPDRPIRFILPFAAGGGTDVVARLFADQVAQDLGQQVVIDNRPSAAGRRLYR